MNRRCDVCDPLPAGKPPSIDAIAAAIAAERERCASVVRYWLAGHAPIEGSYEARCIEHLLDGRPASAWCERDASD
jgi:hypothetical protein